MYIIRFLAFLLSEGFPNLFYPILFHPGGHLGRGGQVKVISRKAYTGEGLRGVGAPRRHAWPLQPPAGETEFIIVKVSTLILEVEAVA